MILLRIDNPESHIMVISATDDVNKTVHIISHPGKSHETVLHWQPMKEWWKAEKKTGEHSLREAHFLEEQQTDHVRATSD